MATKESVQTKQYVGKKKSFRPLFTEEIDFVLRKTGLTTLFRQRSVQIAKYFESNCQRQYLPIYQYEVFVLNYSMYYSSLNSSFEVYSV